MASGLIWPGVLPNPLQPAATAPCGFRRETVHAPPAETSGQNSAPSAVSGEKRNQFSGPKGASWLVAGQHRIVLLWGSRTTCGGCKKSAGLLCDGQWALHGIGILAARRPVNSVDRTLDVGAFVRCAYRASGGDTPYQSETQHKPRNGVGSTGTSELCRRHRPRGTARADGKRSARPPPIHSPGTRS